MLICYLGAWAVLMVIRQTCAVQLQERQISAHVRIYTAFKPRVKEAGMRSCSQTQTARKFESDWLRQVISSFSRRDLPERGMGQSSCSS